jgi:hypothetical protein
MFASAEPMDWKAALLGAKMVTSFNPSTALTSSALVSAPASAVAFSATLVLEGA